MNFCNIFRINNNVCQFSVDGKYLAVSFQNNVIVKDAVSLEVVCKFSCMDIIDYLEWSYDCHFILCSMYKRALVQVFCLSTQKLKCCVREGDAGIIRACWSPDSRHIITVAQFNVWACVWSLVGLTVSYIQNLKTSADPVLEFSCDGKWLGVIETQQDGDCISIFSATSWEMVKRCPCNAIRSMAGLLWSPNSDNICVWDHQADRCAVQVASISNNKLATFVQESLGIKVVSWSPSSQFLALGCYDGRVLLLNNITWCPITVVSHSNVLSTPACEVYKEATRHMVSAHGLEESDNLQDVTETVYELVLQRPITISTVCTDMPQLHQGVGLICFSPCGQFMATRDDTMPATVWIWDVKSGRIHTFIAHARPVTDVAWDPCCLRLVCASQCRHVCMWTPASGAAAVLAPGSDLTELTVEKIQWHPLGRALALLGGTRMTIARLAGALDISL